MIKLRETNDTDDSIARHRHARLRKILFAILLVGLLMVGSYAVLNRQGILDQITAWSNPLPSSVAKLADAAGLNERGKFLLQVTKAQIDDRDDFNKNCANNDESQSIVLGCYSNDRIFVFDVTDPSVSGIRAVIAAHEMLHAAYARLSSSERNEVDAMITAYIPHIQNPEIKNSLAIYKKTEPGEELNELHSLLGTEEKNLPSALENYYKTYFANRSNVISAYDKYAAVFANLQSKQSQLSSDLSSLKTRIDTSSSQYQTESAQLSSGIDSFNACANRQNCFANQKDFANQRASLLQRQAELSAQANTINAEISEYNSDVDKLNSLGIEAQKLNSEIDSRSTTIN